MNMTQVQNINQRIESNAAAIVNRAETYRQSIVYAQFIVDHAMKERAMINGEKLESGLVLMKPDEDGVTYHVISDHSGQMAKKVTLDHIAALQKERGTHFGQGVLHVYFKTSSGEKLNKQLDIMINNPEIVNGAEAVAVENKMRQQLELTGNADIKAIIQEVKQHVNNEPAREFIGERPALRR